jgi:hypothetical protein
MDGDIAVGRIKDVPITAGQLGDERKEGVSQQPDTGHGLDRFHAEEAVAFAVISPARHDWIQETRQQRGVHLPVPVNLDDDLSPVLERGAETGERCTADPLILLVADHSDARIAALFFDESPALIRTSVIHAVDSVRFRANLPQYFENGGHNAVARDDHRDGA